MRAWNGKYYEDLRAQCEEIGRDLDARLDDIVAGRVPPAVEDLTIGSAKKMAAAVLFFDIRGSSHWCGVPSDAGLRTGLTMLDTVIPMVMRVLYDHEAYVEKNTGDGVMAVFPDGGDAQGAVMRALRSAAMMLYTLEVVVNPALVKRGLARVHARIGIDHGQLLLARIGVPSGTSKQARNSLVAVGPAAIIASRLQGLAGTDQIWVGNSVRLHAPGAWGEWFKAQWPSEWPWQMMGNPSQRYWVWEFTGRMVNPYLA